MGSARESRGRPPFLLSRGAFFLTPTPGPLFVALADLRTHCRSIFKAREYLAPTHRRDRFAYDLVTVRSSGSVSFLPISFFFALISSVRHEISRGEMVRDAICRLIASHLQEHAQKGN